VKIFLIKKTIIMDRYILKRDRTGEWGIWDIRRQAYFCEGLSVEEARETSQNLNIENAEDVKRILGH
jgi:hypothetical protein